MMLFTVISLALYKTFVLADRAIETLEGHVWNLQALRQTLESLRTDIESSFYTVDIDASRFKAQDRDVLGRQASAISMTTFAGMGVGHKDVSYYVVEKGKKLSLYKKITMPSGDSSAGETVEVEVIADIQEFTIEVFDTLAGVPVKSWDTALTGKMPSSVRVTITVPANNTPLTLSETVYPKINARL